jgi:hypothetical protein
LHPLTTKGGAFVSKLGLDSIKTRRPFGLWVFILLWVGIRTYLNATVRRTVACRRLDGGNTLIFALRAKMQIESLILCHKNPKTIWSSGFDFVVERV